ncbi:MAG: AarF/ABC1/UbiB kinase family protein, partial [Solirubrobacterales bacterium]|nr:AarF/ABC1/UbiB kinase family protein [Solirubrobacterales bacterium]
MDRHSPSISAGRIRRGAKVSGLVGLEAARTYATKAANMTRSEQRRSAASERRRLEAAEHVAEVMGQMKGAAMKVGQMASLVDFNLLPS